jgi:transcriptional regulator with XRE-family HTH domain
LPDGYKAPGGVEYRFDVNDPSLVAARNLAHLKGWSQQDFSEALGIFASHMSGQEARFAELARAERAKAGANCGQRIDAVARWVRGEVGDEDAKPVISTIMTDAQLRFMERIMRKQEGSASFSQSHRVAPDADSRIPGYESMSFEQRRFAQDTMAARRGR